MIPSKILALGAATALLLSSASPARAFSLIFGNDIPNGSFNPQGTGLQSFDTVVPTFSSMTFFYFEIEFFGAAQQGAVYTENEIKSISYNLGGTLDPSTPSGFPGFKFQVNHIVDGIAAPRGPITGTQFLGLNPLNPTNPLNPLDPPQGNRVRFQISPTASLLDGIQLDELVVLDPEYGTNTVFHFNGTEKDTGRYHPAFLQLKSDGTGFITNGDNEGGVNPATMEVVDVAVGEEYNTDLTFTASTFTIGIPEPGVFGMFLLASGLLAARRRRA